MADIKVGKPTAEWLSLAAGLVGIGLIGYFVIQLATLFFGFLEKVNPTVGAAIIGSMATLLVGIGGALVTQYQIKRRQIEDVHREEKIKLYSKFLDMAAAHLAQSNENINGRRLPERELAKFFMDFKTGLILRGSVRVLRAVGDFESVSVEGGDVLGAVDVIYREIRRDLGLSNAGLRKKELVAVYLKSEDRLELLGKSNGAQGR